MLALLPHSKPLRMEYELQDYNNLNAIHETEDGGDVHDSTTLLDPSEGAAATMNNDIVSEVYNASMSSRRRFDHDDFQPRAKHSIRSPRLFIRPMIACSWQFIVLVMLIAFIIRTESIAYPIVPRHLETLYVQHPQGATTAITLIGSLLSVLSTKAFSEAARFDTVVSLGSPGSKSMSLYSLYARITVGSGNTLFHFGKGRRVWTIMSLVSLLLFTVQTAAWTTILTPRETDIPYQTSFQDINYTDALVKDFATSEVARNWAPTWVSGYVAATEGTNMSMQYLSFHDYVLNRTSPSKINMFMEVSL
ncbi:hypothetical protein F5887DRAFT_1079747 [Amanita rubescens]|nr:hypothetical protein F5887DRAFT_1079747 [Amanita rubescens]